MSHRLRAFAYQFVFLLCCVSFCGSAQADLISVPTTGPRLFMLGVGIDKYKDPRITPLTDSTRSVREAEQALVKTASSEGKAESILLLNESATRLEILKAMDEISRRIRPEDKFVFWFDGHSFHSNDSEKKHYLAMYDAELRHPESTCLSTIELQSALKKIVSEQQLIIFDTYYKVELKRFPDFQLANPPTELVRWANEFENTTLISGATSGMPNVESISRTAIKGLRGAADSNRDKRVSSSEILNFVVQSLTVYPEDGQAADNPQSRYLLEARLPIAMASIKHDGTLIYKHGSDFTLTEEPSVKPLEVAPDAPAPIRGAPRLDSLAWPDEALNNLPQRQDYALLIATNNYVDTNFRFLPNPVEDAQAIKIELEDTYGFQCTLLEDPQKIDVTNTLNVLKLKLTPHDRLLVFVAGHGTYNDEVDEGYLLFRNSQADSEYTNCLRQSELLTRLQKMPCQQIMVLIDSCFSGTFADEPARRGEPINSSLYRGLPPGELIRRKLKYNAFKYFTAGGKEYVSDGVRGQHSPFARRFLAALRSMGGQDGILTCSEIWNHIENLNPEPRSGGIAPKDEPGSDFVLIFKQIK